MCNSWWHTSKVIIYWIISSVCLCWLFLFHLCFINFSVLDHLAFYIWSLFAYLPFCVASRNQLLSVDTLQFQSHNVRFTCCPFQSPFCPLQYHFHSPPLVFVSAFGSSTTIMKISISVKKGTFLKFYPILQYLWFSFRETSRKFFRKSEFFRLSGSLLLFFF